VSEFGHSLRLTDDVDNVTVEAIKLSPDMASLSGHWSRDGVRLDGEFQVVYAQDPQKLRRRVTVSAALQDAKKLRVRFKDIKWMDSAKTVGEGFDFIDWVKQPEKPYE